MTTLKRTMGFLIGILFLLISCNNTETEIKPEKQKIIVKYNNGNIYCEGTYLVNNNLPSNKVGIWKYFYQDGTIDMNIEYDEKGDWLNYKSYYETGSLYESGITEDNIKYINYYREDGKLSSETVIRTETESDGNYENETTYETTYKTRKSYHPNNQLETTTLYVDGERHGVMKMWDENGNLILSVEYRNGFIVTDSIN